MPERLTGVITSVRERPIGTALTQDAATGATTLLVADNAEFRPGDRIVITDPETLAAATATVSLIAGDTTIYLTAGLTASRTAEALVTRIPVPTEVTALVRLDKDTPPVPCRVEQAVAFSLPVGPRDDDNAETVSLESRDGKLVVVDVLTRNMVADGSGGFTKPPNSGGGIYDDLQDIYDQADLIAEAAQTAANIGTAAQATANGKNRVTYSAEAPGNAENQPGDIWFQRTTTPESPTRPVIIAQYEGQGGTSWESVELSGLVIAYIDAGIITAGSAFVNALQVLTNFTLGGYDADGDYQSGVIQSYNFANRPTGVLITENGIVAKGGSITSGEFYGGTFRGGNFIGGQLTGMGLSTDIQGGRQVDVSSSGVVIFKDGAAKIFLNDTGGYFYVPVSAPAVNADAIRSYGLIDADGVVTGSQLYARGQTGTAGSAPVMAMFTEGGGLVRGVPSSEKVKQDIEPMTLEFAEQLYALEAVTARYKEWPDADPLPMFITEQAAAVGAETWVTRDENDEPDGFRYVETTPAIVRLLQHQRDQIADLTARLTALEGASHG